MRLLAPITILTLLCAAGQPTFAASRFTEKQLDSFAQRVGATYWVRAANGRLPTFLSAPAPNAATFRPNNNESFEITDLAGRATEQPCFKIKLESGKVGYIYPDNFHQELNLTILTIDPLANEKRQAELQKDEDKKRIEWIQSQPWSPLVKEAAIKRQPTPGLTTSEVKKVLGAPKRIVKTHGPIKVAEERWFYADGSVLTFHSGLLTQLERSDTK
jgi:hypothetical protein